MGKKQFNVRLTDGAILAIKIQAKERQCSEAELIEEWASGVSSRPSGKLTTAIPKHLRNQFPYSAFPVSTPDPAPFIAPKGSFSKEDLKALIQGGHNPKTDTATMVVVDEKLWESPTILASTPCAPFDLSIEGEPHRVRQLGKGLWLVFLGPDGEKPIRQLKDGELEQLWEKRNK